MLKILSKLTGQQNAGNPEENDYFRKILSDKIVFKSKNLLPFLNEVKVLTFL